MQGWQTNDKARRWILRIAIKMIEKLIVTLDDCQESTNILNTSTLKSLLLQYIWHKVRGI